MGTRSLTAVFLDEEYKVAQYGQWDGFPEGQGMTALHFLREEMDEEKFKMALRNSSFIKPLEMRNICEKYGMDENGHIAPKNLDQIKKDHPEFDRRMGAEILGIVQSNPDGLKLDNSISFAANSLPCEWAWVIDFDAGVFEAYKGSNRDKPLSENDRFFFLNDQAEGDYYPVRKVAEWKLNDLPSDEDFLAAFKNEDEDEKQAVE